MDWTNGVSSTVNMTSITSRVRRRIAFAQQKQLSPLKAVPSWLARVSVGRPH
ncbi:hypothetical protein DPMN_119619 [Dreissena polymorpha]|uniref:Uncharacterized protein n=1 Tax=Dreissena polymorpha TaxID=45954 RepID=A0A9D4JS35_DREPO|nr:hypothetical protein DPMN_119619 [Dreissena polymorpha]